ncbi:MAG: PilZ domain-containing protein [Desulfobacteraceae bacterium]|nr:PilZ domain-containing protein [Desulfobacteraceae bacterium]
MDREEKTIKKYNLTISRLFEIIIQMTGEQQKKLLQTAEEILIQDKRATNRQSCNIPVSFSNDLRSFKDIIGNIGKDGLFIETQNDLSEGECIKMTFSLQGFYKPLEIEGRVTHKKTTGIGVEFQGINPYLSQMIDALIQRMKA